MKIMEKDPVNKRYHLVPSQVRYAPSLTNPLLDGIKNTVDIFSEFSSIILKSLNKNK